MPMKMSFDYTESARQIAPEGEYQGRMKEKKLETSSKGKPMLTVTWLPYDPPPGVSMDQIDKCELRDWISLAPNALFSLKNLCVGCGIQITCVSCNNDYEAKHDFCPSCQSALFTVDLDLIDDKNPGLFVTITKDKNDKDVNEIKKYFQKV